MCGADTIKDTENAKLLGSPPRVRSRLGLLGQFGGFGGITSACAEQTQTNFGVSFGVGDHLRVCGADLHVFRPSGCGRGSPPRVRSRRLDRREHDHRRRITSACAEQTTCSETRRSATPDHLRVCGADLKPLAHLLLLLGSPPRVRSRRNKVLLCNADTGITSACAEQTVGAARRQPERGDHLRVCGAGAAAVRAKHDLRGSPPRVRSRRGAALPGPRICGITSACAEQTIRGIRSRRSWKDHLRVCGADRRFRMILQKFRGSPPRVRSRQLYFTVF